MPVFKTPKPITLIASLGHAEVTLEAHPNLAETSIDVKPRNPSKAADVAEAERIKVEWDSASNTLRIVAQRPSGFWGFIQSCAGTAVVTGTLPADSTYDVTNAWGRVFLRGEIARADVRASNGAVEVGRVGPRGCYAKSNNGAVTVWHSRGDVEAHTNHGRVLVAEALAAVSAKSNNGAVEVGSGTRVEARSNNGRVDVHCALTGANVHTNNGRINVGYIESGRLEAVTHNGRITVGVARGANARVEQARTLNGTVRDLLGNATPGAPGGDVVLDLSTNNGGIEIERADRPQAPAPPPEHAGGDDSQQAHASGSGSGSAERERQQAAEAESSAAGAAAYAAAGGDAHGGDAHGGDAPPAYNQDWRSGEGAPGDVANHGPKV